MSYLTDLRICKYTSPSGKSFTLQFDEVSREGGKKLSVNEPPQQDRAEVQDLGNLGIRLPMTLYFSGQEYHADADAFYLALSERYSADKPATLIHPRWGDILVCPTTWTQTEGFVEGLGQATFSVEFIRVDRTAKFPATANDAGAQLQADVDAAAANSESVFPERFDPTSPADIAKTTQTSTNLLTTIGDSLRGMASAASDLGAQFQADLDTALGSVDALVSAPLDLAMSLTSLTRSIASVPGQINEKIQSYQNAIQIMCDSTASSFAEAELVLMGANAGAMGVCDASLTGDLDTRSDAVESAERMDAILEAIRAMMERLQALLGWAPDAETVSLLEDMLATARARLLEASFSLKVERHYVTSGPVDPISLMRQLTGTFSDEQFAQACLDNDLSDEEFFMLPPSFDWVWYE